MNCHWSVSDMPANAWMNVRMFVVSDLMFRE